MLNSSLYSAVLQYVKIAFSAFSKAHDDELNLKDIWTGIFLRTKLLGPGELFAFAIPPNQ